MTSLGSPMALIAATVHGNALIHVSRVLGTVATSFLPHSAPGCTAFAGDVSSPALRSRIYGVSPLVFVSA